MPSIRFLSIIVFLNSICLSFTYDLWKPSKEACQIIKKSICYTTSIYCHNLSPKELTLGKPLHEITLNETDRTRIIECHNRLRQDVACGQSLGDQFLPAGKMPAVTWDGELEWGAYNQAKTCSFSKNCPATESYLRAGQIRLVAEYFPEKMSFLGSFEKMFHINLLMIRQNFDGKIDEYIDDYHDFVQLIYEHADKVGCASFVCSPKGKLTSLLYVVCNYNRDVILDKDIYTVGVTAAVECPQIHKTYKCLCENRYKGSRWDRSEEDQTNGVRKYKGLLLLHLFIPFISKLY